MYALEETKAGVTFLPSLPPSLLVYCAAPLVRLRARNLTHFPSFFPSLPPSLPQDDILNNFPSSDGLIFLGRLGLGATLFFSLPILLLPMREVGRGGREGGEARARERERERESASLSIRSGTVSTSS